MGYRRARGGRPAIDPELIAEADFDAPSGHVAMAALLAQDEVRCRLRGQ